jgi:hypothetical protein
MTIPRFIFSAWPEAGAGVIILTEGKPILDRIILYQSYMEMETQLSKNESLIFSTIKSYSINIIYGGILGGVKSAYDEVRINEIRGIIDEMAAWYYENKITPHKPRYRRYEI